MYLFFLPPPPPEGGLFEWGGVGMCWDVAEWGNGESTEAWNGIYTYC